MVYVDDGMFLGKSEHQLSNIVKELQGVGLDIEDLGHPVDYISVNIQSMMMAPMNSHNMPSFIPM